MPLQHQIFNCDSRDMKEIADTSVHLIVTSPPYWQLKDYGPSEQIGFNDTYEDYINNVNLVWQETFRILSHGCRLCINIGDQFTRAKHYGRYRVIPIRTEIIRFCQTIGFDYMGAIIWKKRTTTNTSGGATIMGSYPYPRNGILKIDYEFILIFKKPGAAPSVSLSRKNKSRLSKEEWNNYFTGHWEIPGQKQQKHLAAFPLEIPARLIKMFTFVEDIVVDPFCGSGTTLEAAETLGRNSIGYEINSHYVDHIKNRLSRYNTEIKFTAREFNTNVNEKLKKLPYIFKDPMQLDKTTDVKKTNYGSRIDEIKKPREEYYRVKEINSPIDIVLNNRKHVKLLGLKPIERKSQQAIKFLEEITRDKRIYLRFDPNHPTSRAYMYLENRMFVNAHLIKKDLVGIDTSIEFQYKSRFLSYYTK